MARYQRQPTRRISIVVLAALTWSLLTTKQAQSEAVDLLILAGQSNMVGRALATSGIPGSDDVDDGIRFYYDVTNTAGSFADDSSQTFGPLTPWSLNAFTKNFGPEISLGRSLVEQDGLNLAMIKIAVGGSDIARWRPSTGVDYNKLVAAVNDGLEQLALDEHQINLRGMVFLQGESDMISSERASAYANNLQQFMRGFRDEMHSYHPSLGFNHLPTFLVEAADWKNGGNPGIATAANIAMVDQAQSDFAASDPYAWFISTDDFTTFGDGLIHFGSADQLILGERIASAIRSTLVPEPSAATLAMVSALIGVAIGCRRSEPILSACSV